LDGDGDFETVLKMGFYQIECYRKLRIPSSDSSTAGKRPFVSLTTKNYLTFKNPLVLHLTANQKITSLTPGIPNFPTNLASTTPVQSIFNPETIKRSH